MNCVAPGLIETEMVTDEVKEHALKMIPLQRMGQADEVASVVKFLCSDEASYVTRQVISVNGDSSDEARCCNRNGRDYLFR